LRYVSAVSIIEDAKPGRSACPLEENPKPTAICNSVANPVSTRTVFDYHDDSAAVSDISDRDPPPLPRATTDGLDDDSIIPVVWRARNPGKKREVGDRVGNADNSPRQCHCLTLRLLGLRFE
jgi:hypothetical protein